MNKLIIFIIALTLAIPAHGFTEFNITQYKVESMDQDTYGGVDGQEVDMGEHDFCALTYVMSGGLNSACGVYRREKRWVLIARDPGKPDPWTGEGQVCACQCFDLVGDNIPGKKKTLQVGKVISPSQYNLQGAWSAHDKGKITKGFKIEQKGNALRFFPPDGNNATGRLTDEMTIGVSGWGNPIGKLEQNGDKITWSNGSYWTKD